jgi:hypothetical protein
MSMLEDHSPSAQELLEMYQLAFQLGATVGDLGRQIHQLEAQSRLSITSDLPQRLQKARDHAADAEREFARALAAYTTYGPGEE